MKYETMVTIEETLIFDFIQWSFFLKASDFEIFAHLSEESSFNFLVMRIFWRSIVMMILKFSLFSKWKITVWRSHRSTIQILHNASDVIQDVRVHFNKGMYCNVRTSLTMTSGGIQPEDSTEKIKWSATLFNCTLSLQPSNRIHSLQSEK